MVVVIPTLNQQKEALRRQHEVLNLCFSALEAPPGLLVTGFWVRRVDVVVTLARLTRAPRVRGIAKEARGTVVASGACCPIKPAWDLRLCPLKGLVPRHSRQPEGPPRQRLGPQCASYRAG